MINNMREPESLYPDIYKKLAPLAEQLISEMEKHSGEIYLSDELLREMIDEVIRRADLGAIPVAGTSMESMEMEDFDVPSEDAVPVIYQMGRPSRPGHHRPPPPPPRRHGHGHRHHNRDTMNDILRLLFIQQIFGRNRPNWRR